MRLNELSRVTVPSLPNVNDLKIDRNGTIGISSMQGIVRKYNDTLLTHSKRDEDKEKRIRAIEEKMSKIYSKKLNPKYFGMDWRINAESGLTPNLTADYSDDGWETYTSYQIAPNLAFIFMTPGYVPYYTGAAFNDSWIERGAAMTTVHSACTITGAVTINTCANAGGDTNQFLVRDGANNIDQRTAAQLLTDLSGDAGAAFDWNTQNLNNIGILTANSVRVVNDCSPTASDGATLGTAALEFSDIYLADGGVIYLGDDQDVTITHIPDQSINLNLSLVLVSTTSAYTGVIYKGGSSFLHDFHHPTGGAAIPMGYNTFIGLEAGNFTVGAAAATTAQGSNNVGIGYRNLSLLTTGYDNLGLGAYTLANVSSGYMNTGLGRRNLNFLTTGIMNTSGGAYALYTATGNNNTAFGAYSTYLLSSGNSNTASGAYSLGYLTDGSLNNAFGVSAGRSLNAGGQNNTCNNSIFIGFDSRAEGNNQTNQIVIAHNGRGLGSNTTVIGNTDTITARIYGDIQVDSDTDMIIFGDGQDAGIYYDGSDLIVNSLNITANDEIHFTNFDFYVFDNPLKITNIKSGATQVAAGAAVNEVWKTSGHASLPDNVLMIGV